MKKLMNTLFGSTIDEKMLILNAVYLCSIRNKNFKKDFILKIKMVPMNADWKLIFFLENQINFGWK